MEEKILTKLKTSARSTYESDTQIEPEQKRLISLLYDMNLNVIDINKKIKDISGKELGDLDIVIYLENTILIFGVKNESRGHFPHLEQFSGMKALTFSFIQKIYGASPTTEYKFIYYDGKANYLEHKYVKNAEDEDDIKILFKEDIDYFSKICGIEPRLARNDFLADLDITYKGKTEKKTGVLFTMDGIGMYMIFVSPNDLFDCVVIPRKRNPNSGLSAFQRSIEEERLISIANYIREPLRGYAFPNAILLASNKKLAYEVINDTKDRSGAVAVSLYFPTDYGVLKLIDGQHRLLGYAKTDQATQEQRRFPVLILESLEDDRKAKIFLDINSKAKIVDSNLRLLIASDIDWPSNMKKELREKNIVKIILQLLDNKGISEKEIFLGHAGIEKTLILTLKNAVAGIKTTKIDQNSKDPYSDIKKSN